MLDTHLLDSLPEGDFRGLMQAARWDGEVFSRELLGIELNPGQVRLFDAYLMRNSTRYEPAYLTIAAMAGNRAGKTLGLGEVILHSTMFKMGRMPPLDDRTAEQWLREPYDWYHFGLQQETSELVYHEIVKMLSGIHEAQKGRGCPITERWLGPQVADWSRKDRGEYVWIVLHPALGGGQIHFRTTSEKAVGSLGKDMDGESYDEAAFDPNFDFIINEVLHLRRLSTGGQLLLIGTSTEGLTAFTDKWEEGNPENPLRRPHALSLRISTRENIGFGITQSNFDRLVADMDPRLIPQNIDGIPIESKSAFFDSRSVDAMFVEPEHTKACVAALEASAGKDCGNFHLPEVTLPIPSHRYAHGLDPALTFDSTWSIVLDRTDPAHVTGVKAGRKTGRQNLDTVAALAIESHRTYNAHNSICSTALDATGFGGKAIRDVLSFLKPLRPVEFGGTKAKKLRLLLDLKAAIESRKIRLPRVGIWLALRRQLLAYRLEDKRLETDAVMALALAWSEVQRNRDGVNMSEPFDFFAEPLQARVPSRPTGVPTMLGGRRVTILSRGGVTSGGGRP